MTMQTGDRGGTNLAYLGIAAGDPPFVFSTAGPFPRGRRGLTPAGTGAVL
jgi:hypothetical protein